jgi:heptosyltransferase-3
MDTVAPIPLEKIRRALVIRRNRMGDMICTLPLLHALRDALPPEARLNVLTEQAGSPIAQACGVADEVIVLKRGSARWQPLVLSMGVFRGYDLVIAVKGGYGRLIARMSWLSRAPYRIGYLGPENQGKRAYTHRLQMPSEPEHQVETCNRLLQPLGMSCVPLNLGVKLPSESIEYATRMLREVKAGGKKVVLLNLSHTDPETWPIEHYQMFASRALAANRAIAFTCLPQDIPKALVLQARLNLPPEVMFHPPSPLHLAAILKQSDLFLTIEGGAAHLAACVNTPAIVLWPHSNYVKWQSRAANHIQLKDFSSLSEISPEFVWQQALTLHSPK